MSPTIPLELLRTHVAAGQLRFARTPRIFVTVLGSCVAVTMLARTARLAAICHVMLPHPPAPRPNTGLRPAGFRYASDALPAMLEVYRRAGVASADIEAKVFGGANVIGDGGQHIGTSNVAAARLLLRQARVPVRAECIGGRRGLKLEFNTVTGEVFVKRVAAARR